MSRPIRAFFAIELQDKKLIYSIGKLQDKLSSIIERLKLVELENIHMTLRFLGDISEESAKKLYNFLEEDINSHFFEDGSIEFFVQRLSDFSKKVFHLGLKGPVSVLREIHDAIDEKLVSDFGFEKDQKFKTHITIARAHPPNKGRPSAQFPSVAYQALKKEYEAMELGSFTVSKVYLKKSILTPQGPIYSNLQF